jgi:hypothetical protein
MSRTNNRKLRERVRALSAKVVALDEECSILVTCCRCAYCNEILLSDRDKILAHAKVCPLHPCRGLERTIADLKTKLSISWEHEVDL